MGHTRTHGIAFTCLLITVTAGSAGVAAVTTSPACQQFVEKHVMVPVRNRVSKATALAWAKWRVGHPDWKPNPKLHRAKYKMSTQEVLEKVAFACEVPPPTPSTVDMDLPPIEIGTLPPVVELPPLIDIPPMETTQTILTDLIPPDVLEPAPPVETAEIPDSPGFYFPPFLPPIFGPGHKGSTTGTTTEIPPPVVAPVPEPGSLVLTALGMGMAGMLWMRRVRSVNPEL